MIYDYESETHGAVHVVILRMCRICHRFGVESTQSYQLTECRFQGYLLFVDLVRRLENASPARLCLNTDLLLQPRPEQPQ